MLKLLGGAAVILSSVMAARYISSFEKNKIKRIEGIISFIKHIRDSIDCYSMPIEKIITSGNALLWEMGIDKGKKELSELLCECGKGCGEDCEKILEAFSGTLGKGYREQQVRLCDEVISELESIRKKLVLVYPSKEKTTLAICFTLGGALLILLL